MESNALRYLGLARRGRRLEAGEEPVGIACRQSHARLVIVASDASDHTFRRAQSFCRTGKPPYVKVPYTKEELGDTLGLGLCALCAFTDPAMALAFLQALPEDASYGPALEELSRQTERVKKRRAEEKAHQKNKARGKK